MSNKIEGVRHTGVQSVGIKDTRSHGHWNDERVYQMVVADETESWLKANMWKEAEKMPQKLKS